MAIAVAPPGEDLTRRVFSRRSIVTVVLYTNTELRRFWSNFSHHVSGHADRGCLVLASHILEALEAVPRPSLCSCRRQQLVDFSRGDRNPSMIGGGVGEDPKQQMS